MATTPAQAAATWETDALEVPADALGLDAPLIARAMGYPEGACPPPVSEQVSALLEEVPQRLAPRAGYRIVPQDALVMQRETVAIAGECFDVGKLIARCLRHSTEMIVFVATAGPQLDAWSRGLFAEGDMMGGYLVDAIGSEVVESAADWLEDRLRAAAQEHQLGLTNRYSPGYCGWHVSGQHALFGLLPENFCGITLTESALMQPTKSVSGFLGRGPRCRKLDYGCNLCEMENCFRRNARYL